MSIQFLKNDFEKAQYLQNLLTSHATGRGGDSGEYEALRRHLLSNAVIADKVPEFVRTNRDLNTFWAFIKAKFSTYAERRDFLSEQFTPLLDMLEFGAITQLLQPASLSSGISTSTTSVNNVRGLNQTTVARNKRKVFIVHGRDNEAKQEASRFIESLGLVAIILHEQASSGMTIIEKIEHYSNDADFALVLYTPCDQGRGVHEKNMPAKYRARQNVVFEHGYLMAKLGRENVCALVKGGIETPNDISGVVYVTFDAPGAWKEEVRRELRACGYKI